MKTLKALSCLFLVMMAPIEIILGHTMAEENYSVEYYRSFSGYSIPLRLVDKITREEAESKAPDAAYYIGYFDVQRKLVKVVKMLNGETVFEDRYYYYPNGKLKRREGKNDYGITIDQEFDESGNLKKK